ncbi:hypothetical protein EV286_113127 [Rhizobium sp. BK251]|nr:hypothetical protein EV286_113127 [Rhizobium sp. BK251]
MRVRLTDGLSACEVAGDARCSNRILATRAQAAFVCKGLNSTRESRSSFRLD